MAVASELARAETLERLYALLAPLDIGAGWAKPTPSLFRVTDMPVVSRLGLLREAD